MGETACFTGVYLTSANPQDLGECAMAEQESQGRPLPQLDPASSESPTAAQQVMGLHSVCSANLSGREVRTRVSAMG